MAKNWDKQVKKKRNGWFSFYCHAYKFCPSLLPLYLPSQRSGQTYCAWERAISRPCFYILTVVSSAQIYNPFTIPLKWACVVTEASWLLGRKYVSPEEEVSARVFIYSICVCLCIYSSEVLRVSQKNSIFFEAWLTHVDWKQRTWKTHPDEWHRLQRALLVQKSQNISAGLYFSVTEQCLLAFQDAAEAHTAKWTVMRKHFSQSISAWGKTPIHDCPHRLLLIYNHETKRISSSVNSWNG